MSAERSWVRKARCTLVALAREFAVAAASSWIVCV
jgi:hypothetical protein